MRTFLPLLFLGLTYASNSIAQSTISLKNEVKLYPNPVTENCLYLDFGGWTNAFEHVEVYDLTGSKVFDAELNTDAQTKHKLDLSSLTYGNYFLIIKSKDEVYSTRLTVQKN